MRWWIEVGIDLSRNSTPALSVTENRREAAASRRWAAQSAPPSSVRLARKIYSLPISAEAAMKGGSRCQFRQKNRRAALRVRLFSFRVPPSHRLRQCSKLFPTTARLLGRCPMRAARSRIVEVISQEKRPPLGRTEFSRKKPAHLRAMGDEARTVLGIVLVKIEALATIARGSFWMPRATFHKQQKTNNK